MDTQETMRPMGSLKRRFRGSARIDFVAHLLRIFGGQSLARGYLSPSAPFAEVAAALCIVCLRGNRLQVVGEGAE